MPIPTLICKVVLGVTVCTVSGKVEQTPAQAAQILQAHAADFMPQVPDVRGPDWYGYRDPQWYTNALLLDDLQRYRARSGTDQRFTFYGGAQLRSAYRAPIFRAPLHGGRR